MKAILLCVLIGVITARGQVTYPPAPIFDRFAVYRGESDPTPAPAAPPPPPVYQTTEPAPVYSPPPPTAPPAVQRIEGPCPILSKDAPFPAPNFPYPYEFSYAIEEEAYNDRKEAGDGKNVCGSYTVDLPDGRRQIVTYVAGATGYIPMVKYEGEAKYPAGARSIKASSRGNQKSGTYN